MLLTEFVVSIGGAYLINLYSNGGWGKLREIVMLCYIASYISKVCNDLAQNCLL